jgi:centromeric protein E
MYGQTTSGKTYTMLGSPENPGILPCAVRDVLSYTSRDKECNYGIYCSYIEIYNENIHDLLANSSNLKLIDDSKVNKMFTIF